MDSCEKLAICSSPLSSPINLNTPGENSNMVLTSSSPVRHILFLSPQSVLVMTLSVFITRDKSALGILPSLTLFQLYAFLGYSFYWSLTIVLVFNSD